MVRGYDLLQRDRLQMMAWPLQPTLCATQDAHALLALVQVCPYRQTLDGDSNFFAQPSDFTPVFQLKNHGNCPTSNSFLTTERTETFSTPTFDRHWRTSDCRQLLLHFIAAWCQLWLLAYNTAVDVANDPTLSTYQHGDVIEKLERINTFPLWIGIRKMLTNVAQTSSA
jgi:hypothetical protein